MEFYVTFPCFRPLVQDSYIWFCWTTTFVEYLSKAASMFWKAGENSKETTGIIRQLPSFNL